MLDRFAIDFSLCMYCGICIEVCPFDALFWSPEFEYAEFDIRNMIHEKDRLGAVDGDRSRRPPPSTPRAEEPKELAAARKVAETDSTRQPTRSGRTAMSDRSLLSPTGLDVVFLCSVWWPSRRRCWW